MDFDESRLYFSHQQLKEPTEREEDADREEETSVDKEAVRRHFREFLRNYRLGAQKYVYREKLLRMHRRLRKDSVSSNSFTTARLEIDVAHLGEYDGSLLGHLREQPTIMLPAIELAAGDALKTLLFDLRKENVRLGGVDDDTPNQANASNEQETNHDRIPSIHVLLKGNLGFTPLRKIKSEHVNRLIRCAGIVISAAPVRSRATQLVVRCPRCLDTQTLVSTDGPFGSILFPSRCNGPEAGECGSSPYAIVPDESRFCDRQILKLQEAPDKVPTGEMPRSVLVAVERSLVDLAPPGTRVSVFCIPTLFTSTSAGNKSIYLRVVGLSRGNHSGDTVQFTPVEEEAFMKLAKCPDVYDILTRSMAPSISGSYTVDIKKALVCMLMGGTRKRLPDGIRLRGDINVLLLGDPSTAKSQFLKFVSRVAPVGIYTSGKGSSAAGLTASVVKDSKGEFYLEGGAMVLGDGGIVCIDEFDKMRPADRVAIHEAMEQQTISVAKAGITTVLNSRSAVLAAANPVYGRYDDFKSASENIDLMSTILSRFDLIFLVRDTREEERDRMICKHVMGVHMDQDDGQPPTGIENSNICQNSEREEIHAEDIADNVSRVAKSGRGELSVQAMKKYIQYCKFKCKPVLTEKAGKVLTSSYVKIRDNVRQKCVQASSDRIENSQSPIPITVRQLEALVRVAESLARARLDLEVQVDDVNEALRLFRVSTMAANSADQNLSDLSLFATTNGEEIARVQKIVSSRLSLGKIVNKQNVVDEAAGLGCNAAVVVRVLTAMVMRGDLIESNQGRLIKRVK